MPEQIKVPDIGENVETGKVVAVHVRQGDAVEVDQTLIELETDKAVVEIPSPVKGTITRVMVSMGDELDIGAVIAEVEATGEAAVPAGPAEEAPEQRGRGGRPAVEAMPAPEPAREEDRPPAGDEAPRKERLPVEPEPEEAAPEARPVAAAPSIRRLARELGVGIRRVAGSGPGGRITAEDIKNFVKEERRRAGGGRPSAAPSAAAPEMPDFSRWGPIEVEELPTVRRLTAASTAVSWQVVPHVTQFDEADITSLQQFIRSQAERVSRAGGKLTVTAVLTKICALALLRFPRFNASIDPAGGRIIYKKYVNIAMAVDTPRGLLMPVIRDAAAKGITELAADIADLARRSRDKKVKPDELEGGTFSISNQGGIGGVNFTPIVLWPQVAILGVSRSAVQPRHIDGRFEPRTILPLSLSYDHRIIDGADAARFLRWICEGIEQPLTMSL